MKKILMGVVVFLIVVSFFMIFSGDVVNLAPKSSIKKGTSVSFSNPQRISAQGESPSNGFVSQPQLAPVATHLFDLYAQSPTRCGQFTESKVADLDNDGQKEIVAVFYQVDSRYCTSPAEIPSIYAWDNQGNLKPGFPVRLPLLNTLYLENYLSIVGIGDLVGDNGLEIVLATGRTSLSGGAGGIYILSSTGQILNHLEPSRGFSATDLFHVVLSDLNNDGKLEILAKSLGENPLDQDSGKKVFAWYGDGNSYPGWPIILNSATSYNQVLTEPIVVDFESNGVKTIVFPIWPLTSLLVREVIAVDTSGVVKWKTSLGNYWPILHSLAGDVDGDGEYEIVVIARDLINNQGYKYIIIGKNGAIKYQWSLNSYPILDGIAVGMFTTLADLNNDGKLEIIVRDAAYVYVYDYLGNLQPGFPRVIYEGSPRNPTGACGTGSGIPYCATGDFGVADLDGDGYLDIYAVALNTYRTGQINDHQYGFFALDRFGNAVPGYPYLLNNYQPLQGQSYGINYVPTYADIDNDGSGDIIVSKGWGVIEVFTTNKPYKSKVGFCSYAFSQYGFDLQNTKVVPKCTKPGENQIALP